MAVIDPPWRFDPLKVPKNIVWGGCYVLVQFYAQKGDVQITPLIKGCKVVYSRNDNTPEGYEGVFLLAIGGLPKPDENSGVAPPIFSAKLKGFPDDVEPSKAFCGATRDETTDGQAFVRERPLWPGFDPVDGLKSLQLLRPYHHEYETPNGLITTDQLLQVASTLWFTAIQGPMPPDWQRIIDLGVVFFGATSHTMWVYDPAKNKYQDLHIPCTSYEPSSPKVVFQSNFSIFPHARHHVDTSDKYYPIRRDDGVDWYETFTWQGGSNTNLADGEYNFTLQRRRFRDFDLETDHDGDLPPLKEPFTAEDVQKREIENKKRFDARHTMLQLWPDFKYRIEKFRYPVFRPPTKPNETPQPPPPNPAVFDDEWFPSSGLSGPPPVLQTQG